MRYSLCIATPEISQDIPFAQLSGTFEQKIDKARALGYQGVELMVSDPRKLDAARIARTCNERNLKIAAISSGAIVTARGISLLHQEPEKAQEASACLFDLIAFASEVGSPIVTIGSFRGRPGDHMSAQDAHRLLIDILRAAGAEAARKGIRIVLEPISARELNYLTTVEEVMAILEEVGSDHVGVLVDTYHVDKDGQSFEEVLGKTHEEGKLWHVHIADSTRQVVGKGGIDFSHVLAILRNLGYDGFMSAELLHGADPDTTAREILDGMHKASEAIA